MTTDECLAELADILNAPTPLAPSDPLSRFTWDSMALLAYLAFLRFHFGRLLPNATCSHFQTVGDLLAQCHPQNP